MNSRVDQRLVSARDALDTVDAMVRGLTDLRALARADWMAADPTRLSPEEMCLRKGRMDSADTAYTIALQARKGILGDNVGDEEEKTQ
jgi:hypothetical protein